MVARASLWWFMWVNPWLPLVLLVTLLAQIVWRFYNFIKFHRDTVATFQVEVLIFSEPQWKRVVLLKQVVIESEGGFKDNYHDLPDHSDSRCCEYHERVLHQSLEDRNEKDRVLNLSHLSGILHDAVLSLVFVHEETTGAHVLHHPFFCISKIQIVLLVCLSVCSFKQNQLISLVLAEISL